MPHNMVNMLLDEMKEYGKTLADLIKNNKVRLADVKDDSDTFLKHYLEGKIDAYEDYVRRLKKVNSYTPRVKKADKVSVQPNGERWILK